MSFGDLIRDARRGQNLTLQALSNRTGIDTGTMSRIENEETEATLFTAMRLCRNLELSVDQVKRVFEIPLHVVSADYDPEADAQSPVLKVPDVERFLTSFKTAPRRARTILAHQMVGIADLLSVARPEEGINVLPLPSEILDQLFIESPLYKFEILYPSQISAQMILKIDQQGGVLMPADAGAYARSVRNEPKMRQGKNRQLGGVLNRLEIGAIEKIRLVDVVSLDKALHLKGQVVSLFWNAYEFQDTFSEQPTDRWWSKPSAANQSEHTFSVAVTFITLCRWFEYLSGDDRSWIYQLRHDLDTVY